MCYESNSFTNKSWRLGGLVELTINQFYWAEGTGRINRPYLADGTCSITYKPALLGCGDL